MIKKINIMAIVLFILISIASCEKQNNIVNSINTSTSQISSVTPSTNVPTTQIPSDEEDNPLTLEIKEVMSKYIGRLFEETEEYIPSWNKESFKGRWNYIDGVFLNSIVNMYYNTDSSDIVNKNYYRDFFINYINYYVDSNGTFLNKKDETLDGFLLGELDSICESKILFDAYQFTGDNRYLKAIDYTYQALLSQPRVYESNNFSHKTTYLNQIWLDGMYMYTPFYARYAMATGNSEIYNEIKGQYEYIRNHMFDEDKKLYYHCYDSTKSIFWADKTTGLSENFWLRSMGWYIVSLCDVIEYFPNGDNKEYLISLLKEAVDGILQYKDSDSNMFYQLIDKKDIEVFVDIYYLSNLRNDKYTNSSFIKNYLEASGSSMIAYAIMKSAKLNYLNSSYMEIGESIFEGIYNHSFYDNSLHDICITAGLGNETKPYRDGSMAYYLAEPVGCDDGKGVGPFIMAYLQYSNKEVVIPITLNM